MAAAFTRRQWKLIEELARLEASPPQLWAGEDGARGYRRAIDVEREKLMRRATEDEGL